MGGDGCGIDGRIVVGSICEREVGQGGDADGRRWSGGSGGDRVCLWGGGGFEYRGLRLWMWVGKSQGCDNGGRSGVSLVSNNRFRLPGREYRRRREALPTTFP